MEVLFTASAVHPLWIECDGCPLPEWASKWNPIEHRLFSEASKRWAGIPLDSIKTILNCYNSITTKTGLTATSEVLNKVYPRGIKISDEEMEKLNLDWNETLPQWN